MSRILPDPQIVQLRAMRAGDIAMALPPAAATVGVTSIAAPSPLILPSITISPAVPSQGTIDGTPSETLPADGSFPVLDNSFFTILSQDVFTSVTLTGAGSFPEISFEIVGLDGTPEIDLGESGSFPALSVTTGTSVV